MEEYGNLFKIKKELLNYIKFEFTRSNGGLGEKIDKELYEEALEVLEEIDNLIENFNETFDGIYELKIQLINDIENEDFNISGFREIIEQLITALNRFSEISSPDFIKSADSVFTIDSLMSIKRPSPSEAAQYIIKFIDEYNKCLGEIYTEVSKVNNTNSRKP